MSEELKTGLFDYINDISMVKQRLADKDYEFEKNYNPFMTGRWASFQVDAVFWANALNGYVGTMSKRMHYDFLYHILKKQKRYGKWYKEDHSELIDTVAVYYSINRTEAESIIDLLDDDEIERIKTHQGGKLKKTS